MPERVAVRLTEMRKLLHQTQDQFAATLGVSKRSLQGYEAGRSLPSSDVLLRLATLGYSPLWILTGEGVMRLARSSEIGRLEAGEAGTPRIDSELFGQIVETISREAKAAGVSIAPIELGRTAANKYAELVVASSDPTERLAMLKLMAVQVRSELRALPAPTAQGLPRKGPA